LQVINGEIHSVTRSKPFLKKNAIPSLNLTVEIVKLKPTIKSRKSAVKQEEQSEVKVEKTEKTETPEIVENQNMSVEIIQLEGDTDTAKHNIEIQEYSIIDPDTNILIPIESNNISIQIDQENTEKFESVYEDIFEVLLPSTLWGVHRDPYKKFIVFSEFDKEKMATSKLFYIDHKSNYKLIVDNHCKNVGFLNEISVDFIERLLNDFHENKLLTAFE
jgi:hypothetical protein